MTSLSVPFQFITTFLVAVGAYAGAWLALSRPEFSPRGWARWVFGLGWAVLALAETLYGAQVVSSANNTALVVLRSIAFLLLLVALGWQPPDPHSRRRAPKPVPEPVLVPAWQPPALEERGSAETGMAGPVAHGPVVHGLGLAAGLPPVSSGSPPGSGTGEVPEPVPGTAEPVPGMAEPVPGMAEPASVPPGARQDWGPSPLEVDDLLGTAQPADAVEGPRSPEVPTAVSPDPPPAAAAVGPEETPVPEEVPDDGRDEGTDGGRDEGTDGGRTPGMASFAVGTFFKAAAPAVLALGAALAALRSRLDGSRRLALGLGLLGAAELFYAHGGGLANASSPVWLVAHLLELAGGLAIGWWLWRAFRVSIQARFIAALVLLLILVIALISSTVTQVFANSSSADGLRAVVSTADFGSTQFGLSERRLQASAIEVSSQAGLGPLVVEKADLGPLLTVLQTRTSADLMAAYSYAGLDAAGLPKGQYLGISDLDSQGKQNLTATQQIILAGSQIVVDALRGKYVSGIENVGGPGNPLMLMGAAPVCDVATPPVPPTPCPVEDIAGATVVGQLLNTTALSQLSLPVTTKAVVIDANGTVLASTFPHAKALVASELNVVQTEVVQGGKTLQELPQIGSTTYYMAAVPILNPGDTTPLGALLVAEPKTVATTQRTVSTTLFLGALAATLFAVGASMITGSRITRPIRDLTSAAERVRHGDLSTRVVVGEADELGLLSDAFNQMTASLGTASYELREAAIAEALLRDQLETVLQSMTDGLVAIDGEGHVITINREAERLLNLTAEWAIGRHIEDVLVVVDTLGLSMDLPVYRLGTGSVTGFTVPTSRGGQGVPVAVTSAPILDEEGEPTGAVAVLRDMVSENQVNQMKTEFLSNISHELRTPLTPIKGYADLLRRKVVPRDKLVAFLNQIIASSERMERIVDMLVDFSAMQAGRLSVRPSSFNLDQVTTDLVNKWREAAPKHTFDREGFEVLPAVAGDTRLLRRAIDELIDNAVKFSPDGGPVLLHGQMDPHRPEMVDISVSDRGIGISTEEMNRIFQDFVQVDASETRAFGGLGLGLSYVRQIIEAHNGELKVESRAGEGSKFTLIIPVWRSGFGGTGRPGAEGPVAVRPPRSGGPLRSATRKPPHEAA